MTAQCTRRAEILHALVTAHVGPVDRRSYGTPEKELEVRR
jgi:hypothetical protein